MNIVEVAKILQFKTRCRLPHWENGLYLELGPNHIIWYVDEEDEKIVSRSQYVPHLNELLSNDWEVVKL